MIELINGNSFDLLPLEQYKFNLVLTDPPYDLDRLDKNNMHWRLTVSAPQAIVFSPPENQWVLPADQYLFWIKPISTKNTCRNYSRFVEMIYVYGKGKWNTGRHWSQYTNVFTDLVDSNLHPFRKPPSLIERLILNHTDEGDWILDPFAGSCTVLEIARKLNRNAIGIEIVEEIYNNSRGRLGI